MTRKHFQTYVCDKCRAEVTTQTGFGRWIGNKGCLDSKFGYAANDIDFVIHKFKTTADGRLLQMMMLLEIKTHHGSPTESQRDTFRMLNQCFRTVAKQLDHNLPASTYAKNAVQVDSLMHGGVVAVQLYGIHLLQFSGTAPDDSESILWDGKQVSEHILTLILRFDLNPDTLETMDIEEGF